MAHFPSQSQLQRGELGKFSSEVEEDFMLAAREHRIPQDESREAGFVNVRQTEEVRVVQAAVL